MENNEVKYKKLFVDMLAIHKTDGTTHPISFTLSSGKIIEIDKVKYIQRAASTKVGGSGIRYTVMIRGFERYIFEDDGKWFIEARLQ